MEVATVLIALFNFGLVFVTYRLVKLTGSGEQLLRNRGALIKHSLPYGAFTALGSLLENQLL
jgi:hypothetical protein